MTQVNNLSQKTCQAVVIHGIKNASLEDIPIPAITANDVLIKVAYVGICTTDLEIINGALGYYQDEIANYPIVPGHEVSGTIVNTGQNVTNFSIGDAVVVECIQGCGACGACKEKQPIGCKFRAELGVIGLNGGYSEFIVVPAKFVQRIPSNLDLKTSCLCEPLAVVIKGLRRLAGAWGNNSESKKCAVIGAGPIGRLCALVLTHRDHKVTLFDNDSQRLNGVESAIETSKSLTNLEKFDAIIEATGEQSVLKPVIEKSRAGVTILLLGLPYGFEKFSFEQIVAYDKTIVGSVGSGAADFAEALSLLPQLNTYAFIQTVLPLAEFEKAWEFAENRSEIKVLLAP